MNRAARSGTPVLWEVSALALLAIISEAVDQHYLLWVAYGAFSSCGTLAYALMGGGFRVALSGRANSTLNLLVFASRFSQNFSLGNNIQNIILNLESQTYRLSIFT